MKKCVMTDFVRRVLEDIFVVLLDKLKLVFGVWVRFGRLSHYSLIPSK